MKKPTGIFPPMFTVWGKDELYDPKGQERYMRWLIDSGAQSIVVGGSTGENMAMRTVDQQQVIEHVVNAIAGEVPVYAGTGKYSTIETLELSLFSKKVGADGLMVLLPFYFKPYKEAAMNHLRTIYKETNLPIVLYNNPWFAGYELTAHETAILAKEDVLIGVKAAHGDANRVSDMRYFCGKDFLVFYGHDYAALQGLASGANGWLSGFPSTFPKQCRQLQDAILVDKDIVEAQKIWNKFIPFIDAFMAPEVNAKVHWLEMLKWCVTEQGCDVGIPRRPLKELDNNYKKLLKKPLDILLG